MCRNIKTLHNFEPPATAEEIHDAALQFVRKISGTTKPSKANEKAFNIAVIEISTSVKHLLGTMVATSSPKNREVERNKAILRNEKRFGEKSA